MGFSPRLGFQLREDLALQLRYSIFQQEISLPAQLANCNNLPGSPQATNTPGQLNQLNGLGFVDAGNVNTWGCYADGESSLPVRRELANGKALTSMLGYTLNYNTLDNNKNPTDGLFIEFKQDYAGVGGDVSYLKTTVDAKYYTPLVADIVGLLRVQGGMLNNVGKDIRMLDHFQMGPNLVRGFAQNGIGPRDVSYVALGSYGDALGGTKYWGASAELQMPFWFLPKEVGIKGALYADAGGLWDYQGPTTWAATGEVQSFKAGATNVGCVPASQTSVGNCSGMTYDDGNQVRSSVGVGLIWQSPFGPLRFDYAVPLTKGTYDRVQQFRFGGGTSF
jgi:outer membrane protein insertion porin family